jgi:hypothetical protein
MLLTSYMPPHPSFIRAAMKRHNPSYLFTVAREEQEETNLPYHETRDGEN